MPSIRFNVKSISSLVATSERDDYYDEAFPSFGIRVGRSGSRYFFYRYREQGKYRRLQLGKFPAVSLAEAREKALSYHLQVARGESPIEAAEDWRKGPTVAVVVEQYIEKYASRYHRKVAPAAQTLQRFFVAEFGERKVADLRRSEISAMLERIVARGTPQMANRTLSLVRHLLTWCMQEELIDSNPCFALRNPAPLVVRSRVLSRAEIRAAWGSFLAAGDLYGVALRLLLLTGQRSGEVRGMRWDQIDGQVWTIPVHLHKSKREHAVPLASSALELIESQREKHEEMVLPSAKRRGALQSTRLNIAVDRIWQTHGQPPWTPHDLRRTVATNLGALGYPSFLIGKVLGHSDGSVTAIYNKWDYLPEKRAMLEAWEKRLEAILAEPEPVESVGVVEDAETAP
jgi:integrase